MIIINYKHFRHLMSAMLFISDAIDKDDQILILYVSYKNQTQQSDAVIWTRDFLRDHKPGTHDLYIRRSFAPQTYQEAKSFVTVV